MDIPVKIRIPLCIEQGSVFNFYIDFNDSKRQSKNRYFVVLNRNPKTDLALIMVTSTSQIQKRLEFIRRANISDKTIVEIKAKEYRVFSCDCAFNCNEVFEVKMSDLIQKIEENGSMNYPKLPDNLIKRVIAGVNDSPQVSQDIKGLL